MAGAGELGSGKAANGRAAAESLGIPEPDSIPGIRAKREQWRGATARLNACEERIKQLQQERDRPQASIEEQAQASLRDEAVSAPRKTGENLADLDRERHVLAAAVRIAKDSLDEAIGAASIEICKKLLPEHRLRVKEIASRAIALQEAIEAEYELYRGIRVKGFEVTSPMAQWPRLPIILGRPDDQSSPLNYFLKGLRAKGLEV